MAKNKIKKAGLKENLKKQKIKYLDEYFI